MSQTPSPGQKGSRVARLIYASSETNADLFYLTRFHVPDPALWWQWQGKTNMALSPLEVDRGRREAKVNTVHDTRDFVPARAKDQSAAALIKKVAAAEGFKAIEVPPNFPLGLGRKLERARIRVVIRDDFVPQRQCKTEEEVIWITNAQRKAEAGLARGLDILKDSKVNRDGVLTWDGDILSSERLRGEIDAEVIRRGAMPANTIVACGEQACDPHERGSGPLRAHETIILDIFPRDMETGYFGDLTRTVVKSKASPHITKLWKMVQAGKRHVLKNAKAGADGKKLHESVVQIFADKGYPTEQRDGRWVGFFHGTGHSLGLEIHEPPRFQAGKLKAGYVVTVEPGLYYPGLGGVRLEDLVLVTKTGVKNLTRAKEFIQVQ